MLMPTNGKSTDIPDLKDPICLFDYEVVVRDIPTQRFPDPTIMGSGVPYNSHSCIGSEKMYIFFY